MTKIYGYLANETDATPVEDPGLKVECPLCNLVLNPDSDVEDPNIILRVIFAPQWGKYFFYRTHMACYDDWSMMRYQQFMQIQTVIFDQIIADNTPPEPPVEEPTEPTEEPNDAK